MLELVSVSSSFRIHSMLLSICTFVTDVHLHLMLKFMNYSLADFVFHIFLDGGVKPLRHKRKSYYNYDRCQFDTLYKRRKFFDRRSIVTSDGGIGSLSNSPEKVMNGDKSSSVAMSSAGAFPLQLSNDL